MQKLMMQKYFEAVPHSGEISLKTLDLNKFSEENSALIHDWRAGVLNVTATIQSYQRDDYREFAKLVEMYLGQYGPQVDFRFPGAMHRARWMAKVIYCLKIAMLETQISTLPPTAVITTRHQVPKIIRFCDFATLIYFKWWKSCPRALDVPYNDLCLYKDLIRSGSVNPEVSASTIKALQHHLWYLTAEFVPLALFSEDVPSAEKRRLADRIISVKPDREELGLLPIGRFGTDFGKPHFPKDIHLTSSLSDFVSVDSWFVFRELELDDSFLTYEVSEWATLPAYVDSKSKTKALNVTNDAAERLIKLGTDCLGAARSEEHFQNVQQVTENDRKENPNLRKRLKLDH